MHNAAAAAARLNFLYVPLPVRPDEVETAVRGLSALGFRGVNVTVPHKQAVMPFLHEIEAGAAAIGAVNTIDITRDKNGRPHLRGFNTDWFGITADWAQLDVDVAGRDCLLLGAGGSARAVAYALGQAGAQIHVLARRQPQAQELVQRIQPFAPHATLHAHPLSTLPQVAAQAKRPLIINSTPLGMTPRPQASPWPDDTPLPADAFIYDLVYNPRETRLMQQAQAAGCRTANGLGMLLQQGAKAFEIWTGVWPDTAVMAAAIK